ncbi:unnamed protein product [Candidula unifasciata]|uniref:Zinc-finger domain-containing protein n=1 Tax=Candidula unifasciata TaxID=100452 RepID=A0A8S3ZKX0_9EUPU|nr:unnamed protein product [Candidula unifasciata]
MKEHDDISRYEELRRKNLEDNKAVLAKLMSDVKGLLVKPVIPPKTKKGNKLSEVDLALRRNPSRHARYTPMRFELPRTRSRSGSVSSSVSSSSSASTPASTPEKLVVRFGFFRKFLGTSAECGSSLDENEIEDDLSLPQQTRKPRIRHEIKPVEDITEADLDMVATVVSDKKYDSIYGTTCHQCRQKTDDMKTICRSADCLGVRGQFCGPCLRNRYGEDAKAALKDPNWICPPCREICNCSFCRKKKGRTSTGILIHVAREHGYHDVNSYLRGLTKDSQH